MKTFISIVLCALGATLVIPRITDIGETDEMATGLEYVYEEPKEITGKMQEIELLQVEVRHNLSEIRDTVKKIDR